MSLIDWSDPEEMLGLLAEYVADAALAEDGDEERAEFLRGLSRELESLTREDFVAVAQMAEAVQEVRAGQPAEFLDDEVIAHVDACIEELRRIEAQSEHAGAV